MTVAELNIGIKHRSPLLFFDISISPVMEGLCAGLFKMHPEILSDINKMFKLKK